MRSLFAIILLALVAFAPTRINAQETSTEEYFEAEITNINQSENLIFLIGSEGEYKDRQIEVSIDQLPEAQSSIYKEGDKVIVLSVPGMDSSQFVIVDFVRRDGLLFLFIIFAIAAVGIGRKWGLASLVGMAYSFFVIFKFLLPQIVQGNDPVFSAIIASSFIVPVTFYLSHGVNRKTHIAIGSTIMTLILTGVLAVAFIEITYLTGFAAEEAVFLENIAAINMKGILLAGIIIGVLGILDDITISQASIVEELHDANSKASPAELYGRAMKVGRDHISSLINTLVLVYTGASLPLLLLFYESSRSFSEIINIEMVADEIVRTLVGSIGLILAVPLTTFIASFLVKRK